MNEFPTDERFRRIAAKIADCVQVAIWSGRQITSMFGRRPGNCCCPLGTISVDGSDFPSDTDDLSVDMTDDEKADFINGFEMHFAENRLKYYVGDAEKPFVKLDRAYRARFP